MPPLAETEALYGRLTVAPENVWLASEGGLVMLNVMVRVAEPVLPGCVIVTTTSPTKPLVGVP